MSLIALTLPEVGKPDKTEDPKVTTALTTLQTWANGNIDSTNLKTEGILATDIKKEELTSTQIKPKGIKATSFAEGEITGAYLKTESVAPTVLEKEKLTSTQIKPLGIKAASLANSELTTTQIKGEGIENASIKKETLEESKLTAALQTKINNKVEVGTEYTAEREFVNSEVDQEPSATKPTLVVCGPVLSKGNQAIIKCAGRQIGLEMTAVTIETAYSVTFVCPAGKKWRLESKEPTGVFAVSYLQL